MAFLRSLIIAWALGCTLLAGSSQAGIAGLERVASGLGSTPMFVTHAPGDEDRVFIALRNGTIRVLDLSTDTLLPTSFLSIPSVDQAGEGGLLGMAFHPDYFVDDAEGEGKFYVYVTIDNGGIMIDGEVSPFSSRIREYTVSADPNVANTSATEIMSWVQPRSNHNGGWIGFNPQAAAGEEPYLYIMSGDGGKQNDPDNNAQTITNEPLGKVLRLDVDVDPGDVVGPGGNYALPPSNPFVGITGDDEIWSYGLRNPFRASFDRETGDLWIGDVGQNAFEEVDFEANGGDGGTNYGWRIYEGFNKRLPNDPEPDGYVPPEYDYVHIGDSDEPDFEGNAVIGGYIYRGPQTDLQGLYFFSDNISSNVWVFDPADPLGTVANINDALTPDVGTFSSVISFGEDALGNLYITDFNEVFRLVTGDNESFGDYNYDGIVDEDDFEFWIEEFGTAHPNADGNGDRRVSAADYTVWRDQLGATLGTGSGAGISTPEPGSLTLIGMALGGGLVYARYRRIRTSCVQLP